ncbi:MAG: hypothetical protein R2821_10860 [Flavobacteriaceae bacterium]|jgi:hypothetical protein
MKRRNFIHISALGAVSLLISITSCFSRRNLEEIIGNPFSLSHILNEKDIDEIGKIYLKIRANEAKPDHLKDLITNKKRFENKLTQLEKNILLRIKQDYEECKTIVLNGWFLSETEARQCAFRVLINL